MQSRTDRWRGWGLGDWWERVFRRRSPRRSRRRNAPVAAQILEDRTLLSGATFNFTLNGSITLNGAGEVDAADIFAIGEEELTSANPTFEKVFEGSDHGLDGADIDAFAFLDDGSLLLSFYVPTTVDGETYGGFDVLRFTPTTAGDYSEGEFSKFLDGFELGLRGQAGNIDAIDVLEDGSLVFSTESFASVTGTNGTLSFRDTDLIRLSPSVDGSFTDSEVSFYRAGGDLDLFGTSEDVDALAVEEDGSLLLSTFSSFSVPGLNNGSAEDVFRLTPTDDGGYTASLPFDGGTILPELRTLRLNVNGFDVTGAAEELQPPVANDVSAELNEDGEVVLQLLGEHADPNAPQGELRYEVVSGPSNGSIELNDETGELVYTPDENFHGEDSLVYRVVLVGPDGEPLVGSDGEPVISEEATVSLVVNSVNDAPVVTVGDTVVGNEDQAFTVTGISVADVDAGDTLQFVLEVQHGTLTVGDGAASVVGNGTGRVVLTGTTDQLNAALAGLVYKGGLDFSGSDRVLVTVTDPGDGSEPALEVTAEQALFVQSARQQAAALKDRIRDLVDDGELRRSHGRVFNALLSFRGPSRVSEVRVRVFLRFLDRLERRGRVSSEVAAELRTAGNSVLASLQTATRRPWWSRRGR